MDGQPILPFGTDCVRGKKERRTFNSDREKALYWIEAHDKKQYEAVVLRSHDGQYC